MQKNRILISEVEIFPLKPKDGLIGFASFVFADALYLGDIAIYTSLNSPYGFRLVYPLKRLPNGKTINCVHPISHEVGRVIEEAIAKKMQELTEKVKGHYSDATNTQKYS